MITNSYKCIDVLCSPEFWHTVMLDVVVLIWIQNVDEANNCRGFVPSSNAASSSPSVNIVSMSETSSEWTADPPSASRPGEAPGNTGLMAEVLLLRDSESAANGIRAADLTKTYHILIVFVFRCDANHATHFSITLFTTLSHRKGKSKNFYQGCRHKIRLSTVHGFRSYVTYQRHRSSTPTCQWEVLRYGHAKQPKTRREHVGKIPDDVGRQFLRRRHHHRTAGHVPCGLLPDVQKQSGSAAFQNVRQSLQSILRHRSDHQVDGKTRNNGTLHKKAEP